MTAFCCAGFYFFFFLFHWAIWQNPFVKFVQNPIAFLQAKTKAVPPLLLAAAVLCILGFVCFKVFTKLRAKKTKTEPSFPGDEDSFRAIFEGASVGIGLLDGNEKILHSNFALQKMLGYDAAQLKAAPLSSFAHPEDGRDGKNPFEDEAGSERAPHTRERRFYHHDGRLLWLRQEMVARHFASDSLRAHAPGAVGAVLLEDVTRRHNAENELRVMHEAIHNLYQVIVDRDLDLMEKMGALLHMGCRRFGAETGVVGQVIGGGFEILHVVSPDERLRKGKIYDASSPSADARNAVTARHQRLLQTSESMGAEFSHDWRNFPFYSTADVEVFLSAPIQVLGQIFGVLCFSSISTREEEFSRADREFLQLMAQWLGGELERLQAIAEIEIKQQSLMKANAQLEALATIDGLTGAKNRRAFDEQLEMEFRRALRYETPLSLLLLDVDKFKQLNDSLGHQAGDEVLKTVAQTLLQSVRVIDFVARYGGEEFVVLLPNTDAEGAMILSERLRIKVETAPYAQRAATASFGIATLTSQTKEGSELTRAADRALYASKENGRNKSTHVDELANDNE